MRLFFAILACAGLVAFSIWFLGPALLNDYRLARAETTDALGMRMDEARCRTKAFVVTWCTVAYSPANSSRRETGRLQYFLFERLGNQSIRLLRSAADPSIITSDFGLTYFSSRVFAFLAVVGLFTAGIVAGIVKAVREARRQDEMYPF
jgi:hypothetical protein